MFMSEMWLVY